MHQETIRLLDGADTAVLFIHGVNSTPRYFDWLVKTVPDTVSVCNILLKGHGGAVRDFSKASMAEWRAQVRARLETLSVSHKRVVVVGHSLGTLLALAEHGPFDKVCGMLLLNPPLYTKVTPAILWCNLKFCFGCVRRDDPVELARFESIGTAMEPWLWKYLLWIPNLLALVRLSAHCRPLAASLDRPCYALIGKQDELVKRRAARCFENAPHTQVRVFDNSGHCYYEPAFREHAVACLQQLIHP